MSKHNRNWSAGDNTTCALDRKVRESEPNAPLESESESEGDVSADDVPVTHADDDVVDDEVNSLDGKNDDDDKDQPAESSGDDAIAKGALVLSLVDDDEVPVYSNAITGATADPVKDYLKQIGKVALLNAAEEVELAMRIEAGLFAEDKLANTNSLAPQLRRELQWVSKDGQRAKSHLLGANLRLVVSLAKRYTGRSGPASCSCRCGCNG